MTTKQNEKTDELGCDALLAQKISELLQSLPCCNKKDLCWGDIEMEIEYVIKTHFQANIVVCLQIRSKTTKRLIGCIFVGKRAGIGKGKAVGLW
jgi:hypothetical protein